MKGSFQRQDNDVPKVSLIYGWQFRRRTWWYLVFDRVQDDPDSVTSVFTKVTDTFYTQRQECRTACGHAAYKLL